MGEFFQTKSEFYKTLIDIHKKCGQGLSGIVRVKSDLLGQYLDELIEEGLIKCCDTGGSLGHPESNRFYCPTTGYCVWDEEDRGNSSLTCVRLYLGALEPDEPNRSDIQRAINPSINDLIRKPIFMERYVEWLNKNEPSLKEMMEISNIYTGKDSETKPGEFSDDVKKYIKTKDWYKDNLTLDKCIEEMQEYTDLSKKQLAVTKDIIPLYEASIKKGNSEHKKSLKESKQSIEKLEEEIEMREIIVRSFNSVKKRNSTKVQDFV